MLHPTVIHGLIGHVDERRIEAYSLRNSIVAVVQTVSFACAPTHQHAVYGVTQTLFGYRNQKCYRCVRTPGGVASRNKAERVGECGKISSARAKELLDGTCGAKFFFLI